MHRGVVSRAKFVGAASIRWLVVSTPLKNMKVSWDDYSQYMGKKMFQTTNQSIN